MRWSLSNIISEYQELEKEGEGGEGKGGGEGWGGGGEAMNALPLTWRGSHCAFYVNASLLAFGAHWFYEVTFTPPQPL